MIVVLKKTYNRLKITKKARKRELYRREKAKLTARSTLKSKQNKMKEEYKTGQQNDTVKGTILSSLHTFTSLFVSSCHVPLASRNKRVRCKNVSSVQCHAVSSSLKARPAFAENRTRALIPKDVFLTL